MQTKLLFKIHGQTEQFYIQDKIEISNKGEVTYSTISPALFNLPNPIGVFKFKISSKELNELVRQFGNLRNHSSLHESLLKKDFIEEYLINEKGTLIKKDFSSQEANTLKKALKKIATSTSKRPVRAIKLTCSQQETKLSCEVRNIGSEEVYVINPASVPKSISCLTVLNKPSNYYKLKSIFSYQQKPKVEKLYPNNQLKFSITSNQACFFRIQINTTNIDIEKSSKRILKGILISNLLFN